MAAKLGIDKGEIQHWKHRIKVSQSIMLEKEKIWQKTLNRYANRNLQTPNYASAGEDLIRVNMLFSNVKSKLPSLIFTNPDYEAHPQQEETTREDILLTEAIIRHYIRAWDLKGETKRSTLDALLKGYGALKVGYSTRTYSNTPGPDREGSESEEAQHKAEQGPRGMISRFFPNKPKQMPKERLVKESTADARVLEVADEGPVLFRVAPETLLHPPDACFPMDRNCRWLAHKTVHTMLEIQYDDRFPREKRKKLKPTQYPNRELLGGMGKDWDYKKITDPDMQFVVLYEIWDRLTRRRLVFADGNWDTVGLLNPDEIEWPFEGMEGFPFEFLVFHEVLDEMKGLSEEDVIINQLEELDKMRTFQIRHLKSVSNRMFVRTENFAEGTDDQLKRGTDGTVLKTDAEQAANQIVPITDAQMSQDFHIAQGDVKEDINTISAVAEFDRGRVSGAETATEAAIIEGANRQRSEDAKSSVDDFVTRAVEKAFQIMQQWLPTDLAVKVAGPTIGSNWIKPTPDRIAGQWTFHMVPGTTAVPNREVLRAHALQLMEGLGGAELIDQRELILMVLQNFPELMAGGRISRLLKDPQAGQDAMSQLAQEQAQGGGQGPAAPPAGPPQLGVVGG